MAFTPTQLLQGAAEDMGWSDRIQLNIALAFIDSHPELWEAFREWCLNEMNRELTTEGNDRGDPAGYSHWGPEYR